MRSTSEKAIIFLSTGLVILSAVLLSNATMSGFGNKTINETLISESFEHRTSDVLGATSLQAEATDIPETPTTPTPVANPTPVVPTTPYVNSTHEPLSNIKPKSFYITSVSTDLNTKNFRVKYEDGTLSEYQKIQMIDGVKGDSEIVSRASQIYTFNKNFTDVEIENNPGDVAITFTTNPENLNSAAYNVSYSFEREYKKRLFENFDITLITREDWGAPSYSEWIPDFSKANRVVVHHTATSVDNIDPGNTIRAIYNEHKSRCSDNSGYYPGNCSIDNTWSDIGYNYLIDPFGNVYEGRSGGNGSIGAHAIPNSGAIGISLLGNYSSTVPSTAMMASLTKLTGALSFLNDFKVVWQQSLYGHRDYLNTECPGTQVYLRLPALADSAESYRRNYGKVAQYRDLIGKLSFGQDFIRANPNIIDQDGNAHVYLVADDIDAQMKLKIKSTSNWSGTNDSEIHGDNVLVFIDKRLAPAFIGEVGLSIPGIKFSTDLP